MTGFANLEFTDLESMALGPQTDRNYERPITQQGTRAECRSCAMAVPDRVRRSLPNR